MRALKYSLSTNDADGDSESSTANTPVRAKRRPQPRQYLKSSSAVVPSTSTVIGINNGDIVDIDAITKPDKSVIVPHPPSLVQAIGLDSHAIIWWTTPAARGVLSYEIARYKLSKTAEWKYTGSSTFKTPGLMKYEIHDLENGSQYRFTVYVCNAEGRSKESSMSPACLIEAPLPNGWFRTLDAAKNAYYYYNLQLNKVTWQRPDQPNKESSRHIDRYFIDESIYRDMSERELEHLIDIFEEEMLHFEKVTKDRLRELLLECGEDVSMRDCSLLLREFSESATAFSTIEIITNYHVFLDMMAAVKRRATTLRLMSLFRTSGHVASVGAYDIFYSEVALRNYCKHRTTGVKTWHVPREVRLYLSEDVCAALNNTCDPLEIDMLQNSYLHLDSACDGRVTLKELFRYVYIMSHSAETAAEVSRRSPDKDTGRLPPALLPIRLEVFKLFDKNDSGSIEYSDYISLLLQFRINRPALQGIFVLLPNLKTFEINRASLTHVLETYLLAKKHNYYESDAPVVVAEKSFAEVMCSCLFPHQPVSVPVGVDDDSSSMPTSAAVSAHGKRCFCGCRIAVDYSGAGLY